MFQTIKALQAIKVLQAKEEYDPRYDELVKRLSKRSNIPEAQVEKNIILLASEQVF